MFYGEHLCADEQEIKCACGITATLEIFDKRQLSCGWFCRRCGGKKLRELRQQEKIAKAIVRKL